MIFAISELKKIKVKEPTLDFKSQLMNNIVIFKENLKLICSSTIDLVWKE